MEKEGNTTYSGNMSNQRVQIQALYLEKKMKNDEFSTSTSDNVTHFFLIIKTDNQYFC